MLRSSHPSACLLRQRPELAAHHASTVTHRRLRVVIMCKLAHGELPQHVVAPRVKGRAQHSQQPSLGLLRPRHAGHTLRLKGSPIGRHLPLHGDRVGARADARANDFESLRLPNEPTQVGSRVVVLQVEIFAVDARHALPVALARTRRAR